MLGRNHSGGFSWGIFAVDGSLASWGRACWPPQPRASPSPRGGISANLAVSNTILNLQVTELSGQGFTLFVDEETVKDGTVGVSRLRIAEAGINDLCMSAPISLPGVGDKKFQLIVGGNNTSAQNLVVGAKDLDGSLALNNVRIGVEASQLSDKAVPGSAGISAESFSANGQTIHATSISADKLTAAGAKITIEDANAARC